LRRFSKFAAFEPSEKNIAPASIATADEKQAGEKTSG
jgi:hypothetical protein